MNIRTAVQDAIRAVRKTITPLFIKLETLSGMEKIMPKRHDGKTPVIINQIDVRPMVRQTQDIQKWRSALMYAEGEMQQRYLMYDLYAEIILDGFLDSIVKKRIAAITNSELTFRIKGKPVPEILKLTKRTWFAVFLHEAISSRFYGHSLLELLWPAPGDPDLSGETILIPRKHVKPRFGIVTKNAWDVTGIPYREDAYKNRVIEIGDTEELGILNQAVQYVVYKRGNFGDWAEFAEVFGMPFRWATYNDPESRVVLETALSQAGAAGYVVAPEDAKLQFVNGASGQSNDVFSRLREACNEELSITILGNSMTTTEAKSSGYAQSLTHREEQIALHRDDRAFMIRVLEEKVTPFLERLGYNVKGGEWDFVDGDGLSLTERLNIDIQISNKVEIPEDYWYEKYNIPKPEGTAGKKAKKESKTKGEKAPDEGSDDGEAEPAQKPPKRLRIQHLYQHPEDCDCPTCVDTVEMAAGDEWGTTFIPIGDDLNEDFLRQLYQGKVSKGKLSEPQWKEYFNRLRSGVNQGFGGQGVKIEYGPDWAFNQTLLSHSATFSAFKNHSAADELSKLMLKEDGTLKTFSQFKKDAMPLIGQYNKNWLQAEYQTSVASSRMAKMWKNFERRKGTYPNLKYVTQADERVRYDHRPLNGIIRPVDDDFWNIYYPPNGWRCRCTVIQTDEGTTDVTTEEFIPKAEFSGNVGKTGEIFNASHPYFETSRKNAAVVKEQGKLFHTRATRSEVLNWARENIAGRLQLVLPELPQPAILSNRDVKSILSKPHSMAPVRNEMLYILDDLAKDLRLVSSTADDGSHPGILMWYYYQLINTEEKYYFNFYLYEKDGERRLGLHAITDRLIQ